MKKIMKWFGFVTAIVVTVLSGGTYAMADTAPLADSPDAPALANRVEDIPQGGKGVQSPGNREGGQWHADSREVQEGMDNYTYYRDQIDTTICEMRLESCPIDQILRSEKRTRKAISMIIKYYRIGQRPISTTLQSAVSATSNGMGNAITPENAKCFDNMDTILFPTVQGYLDDGVTRDPNHPLMVYVVGRTDAGLPIVIAVNGSKANGSNRYDLPDIAAGTVMLRLGRAAGERDVKTGSYYTMPEPSQQYCQRFIMQVEQSKIEQLMKTEVKWDFLKQERTAMDDMRNGMERSGLFGKQGVTSWSEHGQIYFTGGIFYEAGKDLELGHWAPKLDEAGNAIQIPVQDKDASGHLLYNATVTTGGTAATVVVYKDGTAWKSAEDGTTVTPDTGTTPTAKNTNQTVYEYVITQKELVRFINAVIQDAGNGSRTKLFFVDNLIYQALANLKADNRLIIFKEEKDYQNWHLDFESFTSMGTKILIYRHDAFNYMKMDGMGFCLDPRYLDKWVFEDWDRNHYDLNDLFIRNSDAVVMTEYSGWTLQFPNAHARVTRPEFDSSLGVTDELQAA